MTSSDRPIVFGKAELLAHLDKAGYATTTVEHPAAFTVSESSKIAIDLPGAHTKNLFVKDDDGTLLLIVAKSDTKVDLKSVARKLRTGRLSFGSPALLMSTLGVPPGSVTAFAVINDTLKRVRVIIDAALLSHESVNCHPLDNTATTNIARDDLLRFIRATGHEPKVAVLTG